MSFSKRLTLRASSEVSHRSSLTSKDSAGISRAKLFIATLGFVLLSPPDVHALQISVTSITVFPDNTVSGVYTAAGEGTSAWDSAVTTVNPGGSAASVVGATASAEVRGAFAMSTVAPQDSSANFTATLHFSATIEVVNDDPVNNVEYQVSVGGLLSGVQANGGTNSALASFHFQNATIHIGNGSVGGGGGGTTVPGDFGPFRETFSGGFVPATGTNFYTVEIDQTETTTANAKATIAALAGLNTGLNPALGTSQNYPSGAGHTDPSVDGQFLTFTAKVLAVPEPGSSILLGLGGSIVCVGCRRVRRCGRVRRE